MLNKGDHVRITNPRWGTFGELATVQGTRDEGASVQVRLDSNRYFDPVTGTSPLFEYVADDLEVVEPAS